MEVEQIRKITNFRDNFDNGLHFCEGGDLTAQYLLVVDTLNFCFWPRPGLEYENLARGVKTAMLEDPGVIRAEMLARATVETVRRFFGVVGEVPLEEERARLLREVGHGLQRYYGGTAANLIKKAGHSTEDLVDLVTAAFPGFRDHTIYKGRQVFFLKRAQIFVADLYGTFGGEGLGEFHDIESLTMFADYRVPVVLRNMDILKYSATLSRSIEEGSEIPPNSEVEIELRACSIWAVQLLQKLMQEKLNTENEGAMVPSIVVDWWLWNVGESERSLSTSKHHKTLTVYY
mmetsp:Transcript_511/g.3690  ORF Transcript_511/g.3690 Transcript_511/m.3690 type:complete len:289 (-) Transcript_511:4107-4973(-)